jgi:hypothetical protein
VKSQYSVGIYGTQKTSWVGTRACMKGGEGEGG